MGQLGQKTNRNHGEIDPQKYLELHWLLHKSDRWGIAEIDSWDVLLVHKS